jgi:hypothetical protein
VTGDPRLLERLIRNLIDNAIRHNVPNGHIEVTAQRRAGHAVLTVTNTGPVVPVGEVERLLQPFQRAGTDRTTHGEGLGLGLSIVLAIATAHDADLSVQPMPKGGMRIEVSFPAPANPSKPVRSECDVGLGQRGSSADPQTAHRDPLPVQDVSNHGPARNSPRHVCAGIGAGGARGQGVAIAQRGPGARPMRRSRVTRVAPRSSASAT